jgi:hypothetical protein
MMPRSENRVLASNQIIAQNQAEIFRNKYGDTIAYTYYGIGVVKGRYYNRCKAVARTKDHVAVLKSFEAARNFINKDRKEETIFGRV